jgi:hypothetical protein
LLITIVVASQTSTRNTRITGDHQQTQMPCAASPSECAKGIAVFKTDALKRGIGDGTTPSSDSTRQDLGFHPKT